MENVELECPLCKGKFMQPFAPPQMVVDLVHELDETRRALSDVTKERDALLPLYAKVDEFLAAIEAAQEDIGHRPIKDIIAELGPLWSAAEDALPEAPK